MGGKNIEFEVERRPENRTVKEEPSSSNSTAAAGKDDPPPAEEGSWQEYFENPKTIDNMKFFVMAQSFVMFLTFGLPQMQKAFDIFRDLLFGGSE